MVMLRICIGVMVMTAALPNVLASKAFASDRKIKAKVPGIT